MEEPTKGHPFHERVVDLIKNATRATTPYLSESIVGTIIPHDHDLIIDVWKKHQKKFDIHRSSVIDVIDWVNKEKQRVEKKSKEKKEEVPTQKVGIPTETSGKDEKKKTERPRVLRGFTYGLNTGQGKVYITVNTDEGGKPIETFVNIGKSGSDTAALFEAIGRLISLALKNGVSVEDISGQLIGITGSRPVWNDKELIKSVPDGVGQVLLKEFKPAKPSTK